MLIREIIEICRPENTREFETVNWEPHAPEYDIATYNRSISGRKNLAQFDDGWDVVTPMDMALSFFNSRPTFCTTARATCHLLAWRHTTSFFSPFCSSLQLCTGMHVVKIHLHLSRIIVPKFMNYTNSLAFFFFSIKRPQTFIWVTPFHFHSYHMPRFCVTKCWLKTI